MRNQTIEVNGDHIKVDLMVVALIDENDIHFIHSPNLELTGYGHSQEDALESFELILREYLGELKERGNLNKVLKRKGFTKTTKITKVAKRSMADSLFGAFNSSRILKSLDFSREINMATI